MGTSSRNVLRMNQVRRGQRLGKPACRRRYQAVEVFRRDHVGVLSYRNAREFPKTCVGRAHKKLGRYPSHDEKGGFEPPIEPPGPNRGTMHACLQNAECRWSRQATRIPTRPPQSPEILTGRGGSATQNQPPRNPPKARRGRPTRVPQNLKGTSRKPRVGRSHFFRTVAEMARLMHVASWSRRSSCRDVAPLPCHRKNPRAPPKWNKRGNSGENQTQ